MINMLLPKNISGRKKKITLIGIFKFLKILETLNIDTFPAKFCQAPDSTDFGECRDQNSPKNYKGEFKPMYYTECRLSVVSKLRIISSKMTSCLVFNDK